MPRKHEPFLRRRNRTVRNYAALFALALDTGLRKGELLGLKWEDLDGSTLQGAQAVAPIGAGR
jgi:integrase